MTLKEAAMRLGLSDPAVLRQAIKRGALTAKRVGRDWTVTVKEIERYRKENRRVAK